MFIKICIEYLVKSVRFLVNLESIFLLEKLLYCYLILFTKHFLTKIFSIIFLSYKFKFFVIFIHLMYLIIIILLLNMTSN